MKNVITVFLLLLGPQVLAQFSDDFSDGDFTNNPVWAGDDAKFSISSQQLNLQAPAMADFAYLSTPSPAINNASWEFSVAFDFNPSGSNLAKIYLVSDQPDLTVPLNGYYVLVGGTSDEVSLFQQSTTGSLKIIDGADGILNTSTVNVRVKVTRDNAGNWSLWRDLDLSGTYTLEGTASDMAFTSSQYFGIACQYTSTRSDKFHFDDFVITGDPYADTLPPLIKDIVDISSHEITVQFDETVDPATATSTSNYAVGTIHPVTASLLSSQQDVLLHFDLPFENGVTQTLSVSGIQDLRGNVIQSTQRDYVYFLPVEVNAGDLIFSEIFADPDPQVGLPDAEYVEIYNRSANPFDLTDWKLSDGASIGVLKSRIILPGGYLVITAQSDSSKFMIENVMGVSNFPSLNNSGDALTLKSPNGITIDSVAYLPDWYGDESKLDGGWSLELINPETQCLQKINWVASDDPRGGTPGTINSVFNLHPDEEGPQLLSVTPSSATTIDLLFNEELSASVSQATFTILPFLQIDSLKFDAASPQQLEIQLADGMQPQQHYQITVENVPDCSGNLLQPEFGEEGFYYLEAQPDHNKQVIMTEVMANPIPQVGLPNAEYVELYNRDNKSLNLEGMGFTDGNSVGLIPAYSLEPKSYVVLTPASDKAKFNGSLPILGLDNFPTLNNAGDHLILSSSNGLKIDSINYSSSWYKDVDKQQGGWSLELIDPENTCAERDNWVASEDPHGGTPGWVNSVNANKPDLTGPVLVSLEINTKVDVTIRFDEKLDAVLPPPSAIAFDPSIRISSIKFSSPALTSLDLHLSDSLTEGTLYKVIARHIFDCSGNEIQTEMDRIEFALPEVASLGDLVINEILFNPRPNGADFVEIYNPSAKYISLQNAVIGNFAGDSLTHKKKIANDPLIIRPGQYIVFTPDTVQLENNYPQGKRDAFFTLDLPPMPDDAGSIALSLDSNKLIDYFIYDKGLHSELLQDDEGVSLERISAAAETNSPSNWKSASSLSGFATPGYINSNAEQLASVPGGHVIVDPEVFAPNSGYNDFTKIEFRFDQSGLSGNLKIFDRQGHLIKTLANNETLGTEGFFRWDGEDERGGQASTGYYFVWFEVFSLDGFVQTFRKRVIVSSP